MVRQVVVPGAKQGQTDCHTQVCPLPPADSSLVITINTDTIIHLILMTISQAVTVIIPILGMGN